MCGSTCFRRLSAHHQKHTTALGASGFTVGAWQLERCWLCDHDQQRSNRHAPMVKPFAYATHSTLKPVPTLPQ